MQHDVWQVGIGVPVSGGLGVVLNPILMPWAAGIGVSEVVSTATAVAAVVGFHGDDQAGAGIVEGRIQLEHLPACGVWRVVAFLEQRRISNQILPGLSRHRGVGGVFGINLVGDLCIGSGGTIPAHQIESTDGADLIHRVESGGAFIAIDRAKRPPLRAGAVSNHDGAGRQDVCRESHIVVFSLINHAQSGGDLACGDAGDGHGDMYILSRCQGCRQVCGIKREFSRVGADDADIGCADIQGSAADIGDHRGKRATGLCKHHRAKI